MLKELKDIFYTLTQSLTIKQHLETLYNKCLCFIRVLQVHKIEVILSHFLLRLKILEVFMKP